ncbi:MAG TPA: GNAT family N-acetyltransferase, partial [Gammaproteobacteria bacterium]|nr:GNAT family N-acetyltransferase [Gammaproteobacteria bacterium]
LSAWQRHVGARRGVRPAIVFGRERDGAVLFMLPLAIQPSGFVRELVWLGMDLCDYTGPLLAPDFTERVDRACFSAAWNALAERLAAVTRFDMIRLEKMPERVGPQRNPMLALATRRNANGAWLTPLGSSWEEFYAAKRSGQTRRRDRSKRKHLDAHGDVRFVEPQTPDERLDTLDMLMRQKSSSFARMGVANLFEIPGYADFYRAVSGEPIAHMSRLDVGAHPGAINLGLTMRGRYYHLLASYTEDAEIARLGPGAAHLQEIVANAIRHGCTVFDFTIGDEPYKRDWCEERQTLHDHLSARTLAGHAAVALHAGKLRLKRTIKENPRLWDAFTRTRAALARVGRNGSA